jgi:hypothetical protein
MTIADSANRLRSGIATTAKVSDVSDVSDTSDNYITRIMSDLVMMNVLSVLKSRTSTAGF